MTDDGIFPELALVRIAQAIRELRKVRREQFGLELPEPAWDMIIELYFRDATGVSTTASQLQEVSHCPSSTAARWLKHLEQEGWVSLQAHPTERQTRFVSLTTNAKEAMDRYLTVVRLFALKQPVDEAPLRRSSR